MVVIDSHCVWILLVVCLLLCAGCANTPQTRQAPPRSGAREGDEDVTAAAFGDIYDMSDGALPSGKDGRHDGSPCGDTWYTTWAGDDTAYLIHDDGAGFDNIGGLFARNRLCRLGGDPNVSTADFRGVNLNPGLLGNTLPGYVAEPEWRKWYSTSIHEQDGILYEIRHNRTKGDNHSPIVESTIIKSTDGGKNWIDCLGQTNAPLPTPDHAMFPNPPFSRMTFIQYGKGNRPVNADNADKYAYLTTSAYLARVPLNKLADLNKNDYEYYKGNALDGMLDSSWSHSPNDGKPAMFHRPLDAGSDVFGIVPAEGRPLASIQVKKAPSDSHGVDNVVYNFATGRYVATRESMYFSHSEDAGDHNKGKARYIIYTSKYPWGPWQEVMTYGLWARAGWNFVLCNKFTDGLKMWYVFCGEYKGDTWNYGFQYMPLYLSTGTVDRYEAQDAALAGTTVASDYPSHSGAGYVTGFAKHGDTAKFAVRNVKGRGWHIVRIRYTSPKANACTLSVYVNGKKARRVKLSLNGSDCDPLDNWTDRSDIYYLNDGDNTLELRQDEGDDASGVMIDYVAVSREQTHNEGENMATSAAATASSGDPTAAAKGCVDGLREWTAKGTVGEWIKLDWGNTAVTVDKIVLYDRTSTRDQVTSGTLSFSDGSSMRAGKLQNDGQAGTVITFPPKTIYWVKFAIDSVRPGTQNAGLAEMEVFSKTTSR